MAQLAAWAVGLGLLVLGVHLFVAPPEWSSLYGRDLKVYQAAMDAIAAGGDPYPAAQGRHIHGLVFTSPPFVWLLFKLIAQAGLKPVFSTALLAADAVSVAAVPVVLGRLFLGPGLARAVLSLGFFLTAFGGSGFFTALVINNGTPLYALIALALIPAVTRDRWLAFHLAVALATAFKPFYAAFWIVPVLADGLRGGQWAASAAGLAAAAATYIAPLLLAPRLMAAWLHTLYGQTVSEGLLGDNLLGAIAKGSAGRHPGLAAYEAQAAFSAVLLAASLCLGRLDRPRRIAALVLIAVFLNPRAQRYDLSTAAIPLLALAAGALARAPPGALAQALWAAPLAGAMIAFSVNTPADGVLYAGIAVGVLLVSIIASPGRSTHHVV
ncbi:MAG TPA: hypothetical protein VGL73_15215 [Caulobacteraceae bacterium]